METERKKVLVKSLEDYFNTVFETDVKSLSDPGSKKVVKESFFVKKGDSKKVVDIPPIESGSQKNVLETESIPQGTNIKNLSKDDLQNLWSEVLQLKTIVQDIDFQNKLTQVLKQVDEYIDSKLQALDEKLEDFMNRNVPKRKEYDASGVYKENVYKVAEYVLDDLLVSILDQVPKYTFVGSHVSKLFEDGTICNALISVVVSIIHEGYKYDFKTEVPIVNGVALAPLYMQRGLKLIPITKKDIEEELQTMAYSKVEPEYVEKPNLYSYTETMKHRQQDTQKVYPVDTNLNKQEVSIPEVSQWITQRAKGVI